MNKIVVVIFFSLFFGNVIFSQVEKETDSLFKIVVSTKNDSIKVSVLNKLAFKFIFNDEKKAKQLLKKSEKIAISKNLKFGYNEIVNIKGIF